MFDFLKKIPTHMDYDGQRRAEKIFQIIILLAAVAGLAWGFVSEKFSFTVYTLGGGFLLSSLLVLPPWPMYRRKPLKWQKSTSSSSGEKKLKK